jgi:hypothetical protein
VRTIGEEARSAVSKASFQKSCGASTCAITNTSAAKENTQGRHYKLYHPRTPRKPLIRLAPLRAKSLGGGLALWHTSSGMNDLRVEGRGITQRSCDTPGVEGGHSRKLPDSGLINNGVACGELLRLTSLSPAPFPPRSCASQVGENQSLGRRDRDAGTDLVTRPLLALRPVWMCSGGSRRPRQMHYQTRPLVLPTRQYLGRS